MRQKQGVFSLFLLSPSSRRAWIEIPMKRLKLSHKMSPSSRRAWIEIFLNQAKKCESNSRPPRGGRG